MSVVIETSLGDLVIDLYTDERPTCCKNFLKLCKIKYYHFCLFHNIQKNYIAQTGDPTGNGRGGESIFDFLYGAQARYFEMERRPLIKHRKLGAVSMINNGDDKHGSQFLITLSTDLDYLDGKHTVFGEVAKGFDVLEKLNESICDKEGRPYQDIRIFHTVILDDPFEDFAALSIQNQCPSPEPTEERLKSDRIRVDEEVDQLEGMSQEEIDKLMKDREAKTRAKLLEIIGDIPDADIKPPENVLFVCKLNPVTTDEDLELIFSRFGKINSCEVIRDRKTGDSLCYAFIDFDRKEDCENAYFKMDNVLIDDRRIHVDFSQSVAKVNWKGKGTGTGFFEDNRTYREEKKDESKFKFTGKSRKGEGYDLVFDEDNHDFNSKYEPMSERGSKHKRDFDSNKNYDHKGKDFNRDRERENKNQKRDKSDSRREDRARSKSRERERHRDTDRDKYKDRHSEKERDHDRSKDREKRREKDSEREKHYEKDKHRDKEKDRDRDRIREKDRDRDRDRVKERDSNKDYNRRR